MSETAPAPDALPLDQQRQVNAVCDRFEAAWQAARAGRPPPRLEDYLAQAPPQGRAAGLRELLLLDLDYQTQASSRPTPEEYQRRFPALDPVWLADVFARSAPPAVADTPPKLAIPVDAITSAAELVAVLRRYALLTPAQLGQLTAGPANSATDPKALAGELLRRSWLTAYQLDQLFAGRGHELVLGGYVLLERLGEGGMGQVFKARHHKLGQVVALKLIRPERLADPAALRRFRREIQAAAQLEHRHIVRAHDAEEVAGTAFLVLEYVAGIDLGKLVQQQGPLPADRACDYIRQAALGLQHAFEKGLVHRDVKPSNLLLSSPPSPPRGEGRPVVKLLDLGLARLSHAAGADSSTMLTEDGAVMGTPDFMAPEQAEESHTVDIRADIYSLGCTLYFLLAGRPPFAGGTLAQKLRKHMLDEPPPPEGLHDEPGLAAVLRKMLAKRPEDRYQTPAEVAGALAALTADAPPLRAPAPPAETLDSGPGDLLAAGTIEQAESPEARQRRQADLRRWLLLNGGGVVVLVGMLILVAVLLWRAAKSPEQTEAPPPPPVRPEPRLEKPFDPLPQRWLDRVARMKPAQQVEEVKKALKLRNPGLDPSKVQTQDDGTAVWYITVLCDEVTDLTPVLALPGLTSLDCNASAMDKGQLRILPPLGGFPLLKSLSVHAVPVRELPGLEKLPRLTSLLVQATQVSDLKPLARLPLEELHLDGSPVKDLTPLAGLKGLRTLTLTGTGVEDLSPLREVPLETLGCFGTPLPSLAGVEKMPLKNLGVAFTQVADLEPLRGRPLEVLDMRKTRVKSLEPLRGMKLRTLDLGGSPVTDLTPLEGMPWENLGVAGVPLTDLKGIAGPKLGSLTIAETKVTDLTPLKEARAPLHYLDAGRTAISNLEALRGLPLEALRIGQTPVQDLSPLRDLPTLRHLQCNLTAVTDLTPLRRLQLQTLWCDYKPERDREVLLSITTLETINGKPAAAFFKQAEAAPPPKP
jgi:serine/threonine protein kinase/Leucine-rich repeat (LRR) protein